MITATPVDGELWGHTWSPGGPVDWWHADTPPAVWDQPDNLYVGCGLTERALSARNRASAADVVALWGLWVDIDIASDDHQKARLPPDIDAAWSEIERIGIPPTLVLSTGGGLHAWWLPEVVEPLGNGRVVELLDGWKATVQARVKHTIDSVWDAPRVMREVGSVRSKPTGRHIVTVVQEGPRWSFDDLEERMIDPSIVLDTRQRAMADAVNITVDPRMDVDRLATSWERLDIISDGRSEPLRSGHGKYPSPSEGDMALASWAVMAGFTDQEIADVIVARRAAIKAPDKSKIGYYLCATIAKARVRQTDERSISAAEQKVDAAATELTARTVQGETPEETDYLALISTCLRVDVERVERRAVPGTDDTDTPPTYHLVIDGVGATRGLTAKQLIASPHDLDAAITDACSVVPPKMETKLRRGVVDAMTRIAVRVDLADETHPLTACERWLEEFVDATYDYCIKIGAGSKTKNGQYVAWVDGAELVASRQWLIDQARAAGHKDQLGEVLRRTGRDKETRRTAADGKRLRCVAFAIEGSDDGLG